MFCKACLGIYELLISDQETWMQFNYYETKFYRDLIRNHNPIGSYTLIKDNNGKVKIKSWYESNFSMN